MKINDTFNPGIASIAKPDGKNALGAIALGLMDYAGQREQKKKAEDDANMAAFVQSGQSLKDYRKSNPSFVTAAMAGKAVSWDQAMQKRAEAKAKRGRRSGRRVRRGSGGVAMPAVSTSSYNAMFGVKQPVAPKAQPATAAPTMKPFPEAKPLTPQKVSAKTVTVYNGSKPDTIVIKG